MDIRDDAIVDGGMKGVHNKDRKVVFILYKYSIVVRGLEKKLTEKKFSVSAITDSYEQIRDHAVNTGAFILYLPEDIMDDTIKQKTLKKIGDLIKQCESDLIVIGEAKYHTDFLHLFPEFRDYTWLDRPLESDKLCSIVEEIISSEGGVKVPQVVEDSDPRKRILIVDDDPAFAGMVRAWIKDSYRTDIVTAGMQAITFLLKNPVDMILLDYEMPVVDGPQVFQMLRQEEATKHIPVIFLTGVSTKEGVTRVMELKPDGYLLKSTTRDDILAFLKKKLG